MIKVINALAIKFLEGADIDKELKKVYPDELFDFLTRKLMPAKAGGCLSFKETILATKRESQLGFSCLVLLSLVNRSKLFHDDNYCSLVPTIPYAFALQNGFEDKEVFSSLSDAKASKPYSMWDNPINQQAKILSKEIGLGVSLGKCYHKRTHRRDIQEVLQLRNVLKDYKYPARTKAGYLTKLQFIMEAQLWNATADKRISRFILDINDWDMLPEAMVC